MARPGADHLVLSVGAAVEAELVRAAK